MKTYDPLNAPDPQEWLAIDEPQRLWLVEEFHQRAHIRLPNVKAHAVVHAIVENQIALGDETPARRTVQRLMSEGLDRHESIHAVGSVLVGHLNELLARPEAESAADPNAAYFAELERLTAKDWLRS
jgi:hypothetical protein